MEKYETTKLDNYVSVDKSELLSKLMKNLDRWRRVDFPLVRARWMDLATGLNKTVKYRGDTVELIGINENGALVLRDGSRYLLAYGDEIVM